MRRYRASEAPLAMACPASVNAPEGEIRIESSNPAATVGTVVHKIAEEIVRSGGVPVDWIGVAMAFGLDDKQTAEVGALIYAAKAFWDEYGQEFEQPETEVLLEEFLDRFKLSGHVDVLSANDDGTCLILDWKTTRLDLDYSAQMQFYASLWMMNNEEETEKVKTILVFLRDRTIRVSELSWREIWDFAERFKSEVMNWDGHTYRPGGHCAYCPRWANCPAQGAMITRTGEDLIISNSAGLPVDPNALINMYERVGALSRRIEEFGQAIRARVLHTDGIHGTDKSLVLETRSRDTIDARKAWPIMDSWLWDDDIAECVSIKKTDLLRKIADSAGTPGTNKGHKKKLFMEALHEAGAVTTKEYTTLSLKQSKGKEKDIAE